VLHKLDKLLKKMFSIQGTSALKIQVMDSHFTFINPMPPRDLNAVLSSIFKNYIQQHSSSEIGGILNGKVI